MTTDWTEAKTRLNYLSPYYYTDEMKDCFVFDNPYGYSIKELMLLFNISADDVMLMFERGLRKYRYIKRKGGRITNERNCKVV
jgi:hypothetical protein